MCGAQKLGYVVGGSRDGFLERGRFPDFLHSPNCLRIRLRRTFSLFYLFRCYTKHKACQTLKKLTTRQQIFGEKREKQCDRLSMGLGDYRCFHDFADLGILQFCSLERKRKHLMYFTFLFDLAKYFKQYL